ncbi:hypothetical protein ACFYST_18220 [Kitasatospora sp. NPDC004614]|uniref:hypothetical protein n=1 Tax=unclassified Kitasatospora TaxID=2633591 RepID=UPI0036972A44
MVGAFLVAGAAIGAMAACGDGSTPGEEAAEYAAAATTGLRTDLEPVVTRFHRFGELESAQWVMHWPRDLPWTPQSTQERPMFAVLHLKPGQVRRLLDGRRGKPADAPTFDTDDLPGGDGLPASLAPYVPADAAWVAVPELDEVLVRAHRGVSVSFDPASDTVVIQCIDALDPDEVQKRTAEGQTFLITPSPFVLPT